jgi:hypothetical protein
MMDSAHRVDTSRDWTVVAQPALAVRGGGEPEGRILEVRPGHQVIGRQPDCELYLDDRLVSRRHAIVVRDDTSVTIQDAGSANGTSVNGEQLLGDPRVLRSGDVVQVGRTDLVYLDGLETPQRRLALLRPAEAPSRPADEDSSLRRSVAPVPGRRTADALPLPVAPTQLAFSAVAAAVTALVVAGLPVDELGTSWPGAMGAAALTSVVTTVLQTRGRGQWWRLAGGAALAFSLAVTGVSLPELGIHRSLTNPDRPATFVPPRLTASATSTTTTTEPPQGPHIAVDPNSDVCPDTVVGQGAVCPVVTIRSTGSASLLVRSFEIVGPAAGDFEVVPDVTGTSVTATSLAGGNCLGRPLARDETCSVAVTFRPSQAGLRSATLIVHQNLPSPDTGTPVDLVGQGITEPTEPTTT